MPDPRFHESELPAKKHRYLTSRNDRFGLVIATVIVAGLVVLGVLYTLKSERLKPTPKQSGETSQNSRAPAPAKAYGWRSSLQRAHEAEEEKNSC
jgi:hypothetical protein